jgi:hypothetical protein
LLAVVVLAALILWGVGTMLAVLLL